MPHVEPVAVNLGASVEPTAPQGRSHFGYHKGSSSNRFHRICDDPPSFGNPTLMIAHVCCRHSKKGLFWAISHMCCKDSAERGELLSLPLQSSFPSVNSVVIGRSSASVSEK